MGSLEVKGPQRWSIFDWKTIEGIVLLYNIVMLVFGMVGVQGKVSATTSKQPAETDSPLAAERSYVSSTDGVVRPPGRQPSVGAYFDRN